jgi:hypothetical protein
VADQAVQGQLGGCHRARLARVIVKAFALEQQRRPVELQPCLKHLSLAEAVLGRLRSSWILKVLNHEPQPTGLPGTTSDRLHRPGLFVIADSGTG